MEYNNPLSPSSINRYLNCSYSFFLRYYSHIKVAQEDSAFFGSQVHKVNEMFWPTYIKSWNAKYSLQKSLDTHWTKMSAEYEQPAQNCFNNFLSIINENPKLVPLYTEAPLTNTNNNTITIVDVIYPHKIVDYKTSTQFTINPKQPNIIQATMCCMNTKACLGLDIRHVEFHYLRFKKYQYVTVTDKMISDMNDLIEEVRTKIKNDVFVKNEKSCFFCDYKMICAKQKEMIKRKSHVT